LNTLEEKSTFCPQTFQQGLKRLVLKENLYKTWFSRTKVEQLQDGELLLTVPSQLALDWIQRRYWNDIQTMVQEVWQTKIQITAQALGSEQKMSLPKEVSKVSKPAATAKETVCKNRSGYEFKDFIAGAENQLALIAAQAIGAGQHFHSPLTIVGDHGMGKTHLSSCIAGLWPENQVLHWHAEEFSNAYIQAIRDSNLEEFRARLRSRSLIVIEDLDFFLEGQKKKTMEELMNSLKVLQRERRHIVVTSNQPVYKFEQACPSLAHFLLSGLKVKLHSPSSESISALMDQYLKKHHFQLAPKSRLFIEAMTFNSPRDLFGALQQISAYSYLDRDPLPLNVVKEILSDHLRVAKGQLPHDTQLDLHGIATLVTKTFGVQFQKLVSPTRERHISLARHAAMSLSYESHFTLKEIGQFYGGRQHQSVLFATKKVAEKLKKDVDFQKCYHKLQAELKSMSTK